MNVQHMRGHVAALYPNSPSWAKRVQAMSDNQIIAIYKDKFERGTGPQKVEKKQDEFPF